MKHIVIAGSGSYIGDHLNNYLAKFPDDYRVEILDVKSDAWRDHDLSAIDTIVIVAGIAHQRETKENAHLYYRVNRDLAFQIAKQAKKAGVKHVVFLSSMSVYGVNHGQITMDTLTAPMTHYGQSKLSGEVLMTLLQGDDFSVSIARPPMVYGANCRGNYPKLRKLAVKAPFFPRCNNARSMIYIENLVSALKRIIDEGKSGIYFPQDAQYMNTSDLVLRCAKANDKPLKLIPGFEWLTNFFGILPGPLGKVFGSLTYDQAMSAPLSDTVQLSIDQAIEKTEREANA